MPLTDRALSQTVIVADHERRLRRMRTATGGFDPNENPVIIGNGATAGGGSTPTHLTGGHTGAVAIGFSAEVDANNGVAIGHFATATSAASIAIGWDATASSSNDIAIGLNTTASGGNSTALGKGANCTGPSGVAVGSNTSVTADSATALGFAAQATGADSTAIGTGVHATSANTIVIGRSTETVFVPGLFAPEGGIDGQFLPTSDPGVSGLIWNNGGVLTVSP